MSCMPLPSIPIPRPCFQRCPFLIRKLRNAADVLSCPVTYPVPSIFLRDVAFIRVAPWRSRFVAKWSLPLSARRAASIMPLATSPIKSALLLNKEDKQNSATGNQLSWLPVAEFCLSSLFNRSADFIGEVASGIMLAALLALKGRLHFATNLLRHGATRMKATSRRNIDGTG